MFWLEVVLVAMASVAATATVLGIAAASVHYARAPAVTDEALMSAWRGRLPRVSILKPCKGADPDLYENLISWTRLEGAPTEVLIGVADSADPAVEVARRVVADNPQGRVRLVITGVPSLATTNPKVANLIALQREASGELTLVADSNVHAAPEILRELIAPLSDDSVAASYGLFWAAPDGSSPIASRLEGAVFSTLVLPSIAGGYRLFGTANLIGKVMLVRRSVLEELGGWERYDRYLVEDGRLGRDLRALGLRIVLTRALSEVRVGRMSWRQLWEHELRWTILHRVTLPFVPVGMVLWNPWFLSAAAGASAVAGLSMAATTLAAAALHNFVVKAIPFLRFGGRAADLWLLPLLEAIYLAVAFAVWTTRDVNWRGQRYRLGAGSFIEARVD